MAITRTEETDEDEDRGEGRGRGRGRDGYHPSGGGLHSVPIVVYGTLLGL